MPVRGPAAAHPDVIAPPPRLSAVFVPFLVYGLGWGLYMAAIPAIREHSGATDGQFGGALFGMAIAAMLAMPLFGRLLDRFGRPVAIIAAALFALTLPLPILSQAVSHLLFAMPLFGIGTGAYEVVVVSLAATVESESGSRVLNRAHALFSAGLLIGTASTAAVAATAPQIPLAAFAVLIVLALPLAPRHLPRRLGTSRPPAVRRERPRGRRTALLGAVAALAMLVESGTQQWSGVFLQESAGGGVGVASIAPGAFAIGMIIGRFCGHLSAHRISDRALLAVAGLLAAAGVLTVAGSEEPVSGLGAIVFTGAAISVFTPTIYGIAGRLATPGHRATAVGTTASIASVGLLAGPAVVGAFAAMSGLRTAIGLLAVVAVGTGVLALWITRRAPKEGPWRQ